MTSEARTDDRKHHAGASLLTTRKILRARYARPAVIRGSWTFPALQFPRQVLYFAPDAVLIVSSSSVSALDYRDLDISTSATRFIEDGALPADATEVGQTWRYVNNSGGPDRRFANNRTLPVCLYGEIDFGSAGGLNERLQCSQAEAASNFARALELMKATDVAEPLTSPTDESQIAPRVVIPRRNPKSLIWALWLGGVLSTAAVMSVIQYFFPIEGFAPSIQRILNNANVATTRRDLSSKEESTPHTYRVVPSVQTPEQKIPFPRPRPKIVDRPAQNLPLKLQ